MPKFLGLLPLLALALGCHVFGASLDAHVHDPAGRPVADAVVYAIPPAGPSDIKPRRTVEVQQIDREFVPYVSVIQTGTAVTFPNRDPILHHVYSFSPAKTFEIKLYTGKSPNAIVFDKSGVVTLGCNIHDWMIGYILVVATPHFARTDKEGAASLRELPPGTYELHVWHPQQAAEQAPRSLAVEGPTKTDFTLEVLPRKPKYKPPLDRLKY